MVQGTTFEDELNFIEVDSQGMHEKVEPGIETTNLDKDSIGVCNA